MIPNELCHYTKKDTALEKILFERKIRLGQLRLTNDPKESKRLSVQLIYVDDAKKLPPERVNKALDEVERVYKEEWNVLCMTKNLAKRKYKDSSKNFVWEHSRYGYTHPKMWAHYGENHTGVCLIFDGKKLHTNILSSLKNRCKVFSGSVNYKSFEGRYTDFEKSYADNHEITNGVREYFFANYKEFFLTKHPDWDSEAEFRWLVHNPVNSPEHLSIEGAIKAVLVGSEFPQAYETVVKELS